jgi:hypothetical protein
MNQIELSIWGIRRGFEREGIFHTHELQGVKATQTDRFRNLANVIGNKGFYLIQHIQQKTIISFVETGIREYKPNGPGRQGYVVFSLVIDSHAVFTKSPRAFLNELANFYKTRVGEGDRNNFTADEINAALASLTLSQNQQHNIQENIRAYSYYNDPSLLDTYLTGKIPFAPFGEIALIPTERDSATNQFKEVNFFNESYGIKPQFLDLFEAERLFQKKQIDERERQIIAQETEQKLKAQAEQTSREIRELVQLGNIEEALITYSHFERKDLFDPKMQQLLNEKKAELEQKNKAITQASREKQLIEQIYTALGNNDLATAEIKFDQIRDKNVLSKSVQNEINQYKRQRSEEERLKSERNKLKQKKEFRKKQIKQTIYVCIAALIIGGGIGSYVTKTPSYLYSNSNSPKPKGGGDTIGPTIIDTTGGNGGQVGETVENDPLKTKFLNHENIKSMEIEGFKKPFGIVYLQYSKKGEYRKAATEPELNKTESIIKDANLINLLNERFDLEVTVPGGKQPEPKPDPKPNPNPNPNPNPKPNPKPEGPKGGQNILIDFPKTQELRNKINEFEKTTKETSASKKLISDIDKLYDDYTKNRTKYNKMETSLENSIESIIYQ